MGWIKIEEYIAQLEADDSALLKGKQKLLNSGQKSLISFQRETITRLLNETRQLQAEGVKFIRK